MSNYVTPTIGTGAVSGAGAESLNVPKLWAKELQDNRVNNLVMWALIDSTYTSEISQKGDVLHLNFMDEITDSTAANTAVSGLTVDGLTTSQVDLLIDRYIRKVLGVQDVLKAQSAYDYRSPHTTRLGRYLDRALDEEVMRKAIAGVAAGNTITATGNTNTTIGFADVVKAAAKLDLKNVPMDNRVIVINGAGLGDLRQVAEFTLHSSTGEAGLVKTQTGLVGSIYGMPVYISNAVTESGVAGSKVWNFLMFHKSALVGATQSVPSFEADRDKVNGVDFIAGAELFGVKVVRPDHIVLITRPSGN
jgi:hypothetical protein